MSDAPGPDRSRREIEQAISEAFPRLWRYCVSLAGRRDAADDLAQAACLRALEKAAAYTPGTEPRAWIFRIAQRIWLNELRAEAIRRGGGLIPVEEAALIDQGPDAETNILASQVLSAVSTLPEAQRSAVMLVYVEGFRYSEAAEILDIPIGTVMSRLAAARQKLGRRLHLTPSDLGAKT